MTYVVFNTIAEFNAFKAEFPRTLADPDTLIGQPAYEFPGDENTPPSGRRIIAHDFTEEECALLQMAGADVRVGDVDGPEFGEEVES